MLYWNVELTPEDEEEIIEKISQKVHEYGMDVGAVVIIESLKPLSYIGAQMGRFLVSPFLSVFGGEYGVSGEKLFQFLENQDNVDRILKAIEDLAHASEDIEPPSEPNQ